MKLLNELSRISMSPRRKPNKYGHLHEEIIMSSPYNVKANTFNFLQFLKNELITPKKPENLHRKMEKFMVFLFVFTPS
jgi:hypothetical protein